MPPPVSRPKPETGRKVSIQNDLLDFSYAYPAKVGRIPELKDELDRRLAKAREGAKVQAAEDRSTARERNYTYRKHSSATDWEIVANLPGWISMASKTDAYYGGAHGINGRSSFVWDRNAGRVLEPIDMFLSSAALQNAVGPTLCHALNSERTKRRGTQAGGKSSVPECPDIRKTAVLLGSSNGETFDQVRFYYAPYVASGYAQGDYEIPLSVDDEIISVVVPQYRSSFSVKP